MMRKVIVASTRGRTTAANAVIAQRHFVKPAYNLAKKIMPKISNTEAAALNAGTVGFDGDLFNGNPSLKELIRKYDVKLSPEEDAFMKNQVEKLCSMLDDYAIVKNRDLPEHVWAYIKQQKFFGMIIPKKYGKMSSQSLIICHSLAQTILSATFLS